MGINNKILFLIIFINLTSFTYACIDDNDIFTLTDSKNEVCVLFQNSTGEEAINASCFISFFNETNSVLVENESMTYRVTGVYNYSINNNTVFPIGDYYFKITCNESSFFGFGGGDFRIDRDNTFNLTSLMESDMTMIWIIIFVVSFFIIGVVSRHHWMWMFSSLGFILLFATFIDRNRTNPSLYNTTLAFIFLGIGIFLSLATILLVVFKSTLFSGGVKGEVDANDLIGYSNFGGFSKKKDDRLSFVRTSQRNEDFLRR